MSEISDRLFRVAALGVVPPDDQHVIADANAEIERLQRIIDSRPAINAGLPETYITWSQSIYELEAARAFGLVDTKQSAGRQS